jgi:deazaflavin-dependent oxidoreductase (nitroreductase family)
VRGWTDALRRRLYKIFARVHGQLVVRTRGRPEHLSPRLRCLVLETTGRRSNEPRRVPLLYMPDGGGFIVLASNFGQEHPPAWWLNLQVRPSARVYLRGRLVTVAARELEGDERTSVLDRAAAHNRQWRGYATRMRRTLPVIRLEPVAR